MKKVLTMIAVAAVAVSATADLTTFSWAGGKALAADGVTSLPAGTLINTTTVDLSAFVVGGQIDIADIPASFYDSRGIGVAPPFLGGTYSTTEIAGNNTIEGQVLPEVFAVLLGTGGLAVGDFIGISAGFQTVDLQPTPDPPALPQVFNTGDLVANIEVVPEPATLGLMGIAGLGMFLARRKARR